jgi:hypothetical protein
MNRETAVSEAVRANVRRRPVLLAALLFSFLFSTPAFPQTTQLSVVERFHATRQRFWCTVSYPPSDCERDLAALRGLLARYNAEALGEWQWVLVSRAEWAPFSSELGTDGSSPAMTMFLDHQTLFDQGLFSRDEDRAEELARKFGVPWEQLLALAVSHELGHAFCRATDEMTAEFFAEELRHGRDAQCARGTVAGWSVRSAPGRRRVRSASASPSRR